MAPETNPTVTTASRAFRAEHLPHTTQLLDCEGKPCERLPFSFLRGPQEILEGKPESELDHPWMTTENMGWNEQIRESLRDCVVLGHSRCADGRHCVNRPWHVLWMIESIQQISAKLNLFRLSNCKLLEDRKIQILNWPRQESVASRICEGTIPCLNISGIRIRCHVTHRALCVCEGATAIRVEAGTGLQQC